MTGIAPRAWVAVHRKHHAFSDTPQDPHSPIQLGFWAVQLGNVKLYRNTIRDGVTVTKYSRDLPPDRLKLEVTESLVMDHARIGELLARCHAVGMPVALDDFGTGYSNLGPLLTLNFDQIKLDASFIRALDRPRGVAMVGVIVGMAHRA